MLVAAMWLKQLDYEALGLSGYTRDCYAVNEIYHSELFSAFGKLILTKSDKVRLASSPINACYLESSTWTALINWDITLAFKKRKIWAKTSQNIKIVTFSPQYLTFTDFLLNFLSFSCQFYQLSVAKYKFEATALILYSLL